MVGSELVAAPQGAFVGRAGFDFRAGLAELLLGGAEQLGGGGGVAVAELELGGLGEGRGFDVQGVRGLADIACLADLGAGARKLAELSQCFRFAGVGRVANDFDRAREAPGALLGKPVLGRAAGERGERGRRSREQRRQRRCAQSLDFGGGPIWIRSPMYEPINVNTTPRKDMSAYMKAGMVLTVCPA